MTRSSRITTTALAGAIVAALVGCAPTASEPTEAVDENAPVTISVMGLPTATNEALRAAFNDDVAAFEAEFPNITVEPTDEIYAGPAFAAQIAGGQAQTVVVVPFTEPAALIERGQVSDISAEIESIDGLGELNPAALGVLQSEGKTYGLPQNVYALGLVYNRDLFAQAGLDPDDPPSTWDEVREAAKTISDETGVAGFGSMTTDAGGGWQLTAQTVASGENIQVEADGAFESNIANDATRDVLQWQHDLRFEDDSIGTNMLRNQQDVEQAFSSGEIAMAVATPSFYNRYTGQYGGAPESFGVTVMPQENDANTTLIGGSAVMVTSIATPEERAAAVKWIEFEYIRPKSDPEFAATQAEAQAADNVAVGIPFLPLFNDDKQSEIDAAVEPFVNIDLEHFAPYIDGVAEVEFAAEPPVASQQIYKSLDAVVQAVLTEEDADIDALLESADAEVQSLIVSAG